jgi:N-acetylmuramoyl-L-alanine amidase
MKASAIPDYEKTFRDTGIDGQGKKFTLKDSDFKIGITAETIKISNCTREDGFKDFYYDEETAKKKIVLHFTMGYVKGDIATLTKEHVSVPFVVARDGSVYNLFASKYWSYHLGKNTSGGNLAMSKESIGIEISNIGPLKKIGNNLVTTYSDSDVYCTLSDTQFYTKLATPYRNFDYYATFTDIQYEATIKLLRFLCAKYSLPTAIIAEPKRYETFTAAEFVAYRGIATHVNCRKDKVDIGPAFDWKRIITGLK